MTKSRDLADNSQNTKPKVVDAKGDLIVGTGADAADRLAVGANGDTLVADSSTSTGLRYNPQPVLGNPFINGGFDFFQRSGTPTTGITVTGGYAMTVDRWWGRTASGAGSMVVSQQSAQDANLPSIRYCVRSRRATSNTDTNGLQLWSFFETSMSIPFSGRAVTVSFYARKAAGFTGTFVSELFSGTGTDQNELNGTYTDRTTVASGTHTLTTSWQRFVITGTIASTATELGFIFSHNPTGTAGSDDYYEVTGVQLDIGTYTASSAPAFRRAGGTIQGELAACQRYYVRYSAQDAYSYFSGNGYAVSTTVARTFISFPVTMRTTPSSVETNLLGLRQISNDTLYTSGTFSADGLYPYLMTLKYTHGSAVFTAGNVCILTANNSTSAYIGMSAEL